MSTCIFNRTFSARSRDNSICSGVTGLVPAPLSVPACEDLNQFRSVCSTSPSSRAAGPIFTSCARLTACALYSAVYSCFGIFFISSRFNCRYYPPTLGRRNSEGSSPYAFSLHPQGNPRYYGDDRTEQHGRVLGEFSIDGIRHVAEGFLIRDHSWGPRIWGLNQHYKWFHAVNAQCSVHFFEMQSFGRRQLRGFLWRDGRMEHIAQLDCNYSFDEQMMHQTLRATVVDATGRVANIECKAFATIQLEFDPMVYLNEAALTLEIDGQPGVGWCEFCWNRDYFRFAQKFVDQYG